jgi:holo-[acyl-carrier protein] synthase
MIAGIGTDVVNIARVEKMLARFGERFEQRLFTAQEIAFANIRAKAGQHIKAATLAKRIAAKEAFVKALGTGFAGGISWQDIEVVHQQGERPTIVVKGLAIPQYLRALSPKGAPLHIDVSMADDYPIAQAFVVISVG